MYLGRIGVHHIGAVNLVLVGIPLDELVEALVGEGLRSHLNELHVIGRQRVLPVVGGQVGVFHEVVVHGVLVVPQLEVEEVDDVIGRVLSQREILRPTVPEEIPGDVDYVIPCVDRLPDVYVGELVGTQQHPAVLVGLGIAVVVIDVFVVHDRRRGRCPLSSLLVAFMGVGRGVAFCWCPLGRCCVGAGGAFSVLGR